MNETNYRPAFHFSPEKNWMNDPNGLCYLDGEYHLFYQHHPESRIWGPMHWGHAVSRDLLHWEHLPIALYPDENGMIFSGSVVVDDDNTTGLQEGEQKVMVALFTYHKEGHETQGVAFSTDKGRTWEKHQSNPVIRNPGLEDFRDPKVTRFKNHWVMSLACGDHIQFYRSENLLEWTYLSSFGQEYGAHGGVWECPDLIRFDDKWVLIVSINPGGPNGGSAIQYFTGEFDGERFNCDQPQDEIKWADYGRDFYAAVTWSGTEEPLWIGWMNNWEYANEVPTQPFRGTMSIPRVLSLKKGRLIQKPISLSPIQNENLTKDVQLQPGHSETLTSSKQISLIALLKNDASAFTLTVGGDDGKVDIRFDSEEQVVQMDRTKSSETTFSKVFPSVDSMTVESIEEIQLIIDEGSIELFLNGGAHAMSEIAYIKGDELTITLHAASDVVELEMGLIDTQKAISEI
ncbi:glycoside hydrolase family 32 protein [Halobacillus litoralis]|uniref:glycoside hydrolase family 32 protein n=1 Tax=Halobacillus litoralis TaxID=45668 RepID=UPI001CD56C2F|nr:glycoside hydrolase family 32 protein [Halobacillus litoralis]MCA0972099.1 glycoside hydrolase family 32 protein [Halobacillus litoralis]